MEKLRIYPDPVLRHKACPVDDFNPERLCYVIDVMKKVLKEKEAVGIAATQLGILEQIILTYVDEQFISLINPQIIKQKGKFELDEGCLSLPGVEINMRRPNFIVVGSFDEAGKKKTIEAQDILSRAIQHEIDHLNGRLIIDSLSPTERLKFDIQWKEGDYERKNPSQIL